MTIKNYILFLSFLLFSCFTFGQSNESVQFVENKGQWNSQVKFMAEVPAGAIYIHDNGFTILQHEPQSWESAIDRVLGHLKDEPRDERNTGTTIKSHAYRVDFLNAAAHPQIIADKPLNNYNNYFKGDDPSKWATDCKIYLGITVKNLYPGIDIRYYSQNGRVKYDLIVNPGADVSKVALKYNGIDKLEVKNKELFIPTSVGILKELAPYSYQPNESGRKEIVSKYVVNGNVMRFDVRNYDKNLPLILDPTLIFCSFSGSMKDNWGFTATYGPDGSMYGGGISLEGGFPVSPGAFQTTFGGGSSNPVPEDIVIIKLTPDGRNRVYATYIGGSGNEQPHSLVVDQQGNLVIAGRTNSPISGAGSYPTKGFTSSNLGNYDIIVTKLNATGTALIGSARIGGSADDGANINASRSGANSLQRNYGDDGRSEVILDGGNNIYVASCTQSTNFYVQNAFQNNNAGKQDGVIIKLTPDASNVIFSSYLGGDGNDAAYVLSLNPFTGQIYIAGGTESSGGSMPGNTSGTIGVSNQGNIDGFVSIIGNSGGIQKTTFIGTSGIDQVYGIQFDKFGYPYVTGQTTGDWPHINAAYYDAGAKQFIAKLEPDLSRYVYSTAFGKSANNPSISITAFLVDRCENVYVSGWGGSISSGTNYQSSGTNGLPVTPDAIKATTDGKDFYFFVLKKNATAQLFGSFFGQDGYATDHVDGGTSRFDRNGVIYQAICANCKQFGPTPFPTTPGAWQETNPSPGCNLAMVKIEMNFAGVHSGVRSSIRGILRDTAGCVPLTVDFTDTVRNAVSYEWQFGDGSPQITTATPSASHTYNVVGTYRVMLVAIDSSTCNIRDTSYLRIRVGDIKADLDFNPVKLNPCDSFRYRFDNLSRAPGTQPFNGQSFEWDFGDGTPRLRSGLNSVFHTYANPGTYNVRLLLLDSAFCNYPDSVVKTLRVAALVKAQFETLPTGCAPYPAQFTNTSMAGQNFTWNFGDGATSTDHEPLHIYTTPGTYTIKLIARDSATCNFIDSIAKTITVAGIPTANFSAAPQPPLVNTPVTFTNLSSPDAVRFKWLFGDGDSLVVNSAQPVQHEYNSTGTFNACLIAFNIANCTDTICQPVQALVDAAVDVPTAFTPLSSDANNKVFVRGYGITKMKFSIWARWGEKVFETQSKSIGWDGRYKGALLPMDVYAYTLEVEFFDGKKTSKKGDITLIR
ncbi:PKD domain-containing protein [Chitinophagaceae bacterium LB-8]|uniref:PKD domain-containing protein n=1 Tax=Paraflavisolibacter caeni TaxID=2982496 RepID=A0A9X2XNF9_9BACT|nr:PKD domain-containing protein [Paraflavisolibacter caeni]MCU7548653.1 PKD domain-containing protein [Paraflavisolibacter caeni]